MKSLDSLKRLSLALVCIGMVFPITARAETPAGPHAAIPDVALGDGGRLFGQVVDAAGTPKAGSVVQLLSQQRVVAEATTDVNGYFAVDRMRGGTYQVATANGGALFRLWAPHTAPPSAQAGVLVVSDQNVVLGQGPLTELLTNPWVVAGIIGAAIVVPIALHNNNSSS